MNRATTTKKLGLDLSSHYDDVARIVKSKFPMNGSEADDLIQEVCKKIVKLNEGTSPYDPDKSSKSHYIYLVASSVFSTTLSKRKREPTSEAIDFDYYSEVLDDSTVVTVEREDLGILTCDGFVAEFVTHIENVLDPDDTIPRRILMLTSMGYTKKDISEILNVSFYRVDKDRTRLKKMAKDWLEKKKN